MFNKNIFLPALACILFSSCGGGKHAGKAKVSLPGTWQAQPITIDGNSIDWPSPYPNYDAKSMVAYATANDSENLYITMETGDEMTQMKILKQGMTILIDTAGHKDGQLKINYPLPNDNDPLDLAKDETGFNRENKGRENHRWEKAISKSAGQATQYSLEGFDACNGGYAVSQTSACGIKIKMGIDEYKELIVEVRVPLKTIYGRAHMTAADAGHPISVCFAVKGFKAPGTKNNDNNNSASNANMGGVGMNSSMGGRGGGRGGSRPTDNPMQHLYESTKTWKQFGLAWHQ